MAVAGMLFSLLGLGIEFLAVLAMACYGLRRRLPWSPFSVASAGFLLYLIGFVLYVCATA